MQGGTERVDVQAMLDRHNRRNPLDELIAAPMNTRGQPLADLLSNVFRSAHIFYNSDGSLSKEFSKFFPSDPMFGPNPCPNPFMASQQAPGGIFSSDPMSIVDQRPSSNRAAQEAPNSEQVNEEKYADADEEDEDSSNNTNSGKHVRTEAQPAARFTTERTTASDGLKSEEYKEVGSVTDQAAAAAHRRIHEKMDAMQKKYNISQVELDDLFEEIWNGKSRKRLPGECSTHEGLGEPRRDGGWPLSSTEELRDSGSSSCSCGEC